VQAKQLEDPIQRWGQYLLDENLATEDDLARMREEAEHEVEEAVTFARESDWPSQEELYTDVYAD
ncbi:MAG TPA: thiamine pyrophosphate-dependent enzyme, partial [Aggregatilineales bacterium]|nr:thiamine pyrophosphate-dependent enzyme [Aggregatilineales bacterium]